MAPVFLLAVFLGNAVLAAVLLVAGLRALYEWLRMTRGLSPVFIWLPAGVVYIALSFASFYFLRDNFGVFFTFLYIFMVWASDIGAFFTGKFIGGPKMAEALSPNKTWAGMAGAVCWPVVMGLLFVGFNLVPVSYSAAVILGLVSGVSGQAGDLLISFSKRKAGVKDTGQLIPGHGGLLDRIDSMMLSVPFFYLLLMLLVAV